ncbi:MAG: hypothetical protein FWE67_10035, partial [Planctomycetaceae bacterium]|nr:hypothetical protein [Planctomycetaceae bacterium]
MSIARRTCFAALLLSLCTFLSAKEPDALFFISPSALPQTAFAQKLTAQPEWEPAYTLFCDAVGKGIRKELSDRQKLEQHLPPKVADAVNMLVQMVEIQQL